MDFLGWLAEAKSPDVRFAAGFGCLAAAALGVPLLLSLLLLAALPHMSLPPPNRPVFFAAVLALLFGLAAGTAAAMARPRLVRAIGRRGTIALLAILVLAAAAAAYGPAFSLLERGWIRD